MPSQGLPPFRITAGKYDLTYEAENITFSNADPGGYETASFDLGSDKADILQPGDRVRIQDGLSVVWEGRISEPAKTVRHGWHQNRKVGSTTTRVSCEGMGSQMKDNLMSMVYIDRDLSRWTSPTTARQINMIGLGWDSNQFSFQVGSDTALGLPGLMITASGQLVGQPNEDIWYDSGPSNLVGRIRIGTGTALTYTFPDANNLLQVFVCSDDVATNFLGSGSFAGATPTVDFSPATAYRYALIQHRYTASGVSVGNAGTTYGYVLRQISVLGNHGLSLRGSAPNDGYYPSDIARDVARRAQFQGAKMRLGQIDDQTSYIVSHEAEYSSVPHEKIISDMANLSPVHYGTWENTSLFDDTPEFTYRSYYTEANVFTSLSDCNEVDVSERLANLYTTAVITYQDAAGTPFVVQVSLPNAMLDRVGLKRTIQLDLGLSSTAAAQTFANFALQVLFAQARTAGNIELPKQIRTRTGGFIPAYRVRSGIDRIRVSDLPTRLGEFTANDTDSFRISRSESTIDTTSGEITTRIEVDAGPNLIETLQARLQVATKLSGLGF